MEKDDEIKGSGNSYDFGARIYDPRLGRWLGLDRLATKNPMLYPKWLICMGEIQRFCDNLLFKYQITPIRKQVGTIKIIDLANNPSA